MNKWTKRYLVQYLVRIHLILEITQSKIDCETYSVRKNMYPNLYQGLILINTIIEYCKRLINIKN